MKIIFDNEHQKEVFMKKVQKFFCPTDLDLIGQTKDNYCRSCSKCWNETNLEIVINESDVTEVVLTIQGIARLISGEHIERCINGEIITFKFDKDGVNHANQN